MKSREITIIKNGVRETALIEYEVGKPSSANKDLCFLLCSQILFRISPRDLLNLHGIDSFYFFGELGVMGSVHQPVAARVGSLF